MLTQPPKYQVHPAVQAPATPESGRQDPTSVRMLKDARGMTSHEKRPRIIEVSRGSWQIVSRDLADLWVASGTCEIRDRSAPQPPPEPEMDPEPAPQDEKPPRKTRRTRRR